MYIPPSDLKSKVCGQLILSLNFAKNENFAIFPENRAIRGKSTVPRGFWEREPNGGNMEVMIVDC